MKHKRTSTLCFVLALIIHLTSSSIYAHSARTDVSGGHYNRATGEYHYHNSDNTGNQVAATPPRRSLEEIFGETEEESAPTPTQSSFAEVVRDNSWLIYVNVGSIEDRGDYLVAWSKWIPRGDNATELKQQSGQAVAHLMMLEAFNKSARQVQVLSWHIYDINNRVIESDSDSFSAHLYEEIIPGSYSARIREFVFDYRLNKLAEIMRQPERPESADTPIGKEPTNESESWLLELEKKFANLPSSVPIDNAQPKKFSTLNHPKANGLHVTIEYPSIWRAEEGERPHIVQKFTGSLTKNALPQAMILVIDTGLPKDTVATEQDYQKDDIMQMLPTESQYIDSQNIHIDGEPGVLLKYFLEGERVVERLQTLVSTYVFFYQGQLFMLQCSVASSTELSRTELDRIFLEYEPIFFQIANSIVIQDKWNEEDDPIAAALAKMPTQTPTAPSSKIRVATSSNEGGIRIPWFFYILARDFILCIPVIILRFLIRKRSFGVGASLSIAFLMLVATTALARSSYAPGGVAVLSYFLLRAKSEKEKNEPGTQEEIPAIKPIVGEIDFPAGEIPPITAESISAPVDYDFEDEDDEQEEPVVTGQHGHGNLLENVIFYIIARSTQKRFSYEKLKNYLILINRAYSLDIEVKDNGRGGKYIVGLWTLMLKLQQNEDISTRKVILKSGKGHRTNFRVLKKVSPAILPDDMRDHIDSLIVQWDNKRSRSMLV